MSKQSDVLSGCCCCSPVTGAVLSATEATELAQAFKASGQALAGVVGPLIEVPVLVALVYVSLALRAKLLGPPDPRVGLRDMTR